jgi:hypothetical protein
MIEVSDAFDEYHRLVNEAWLKGGYRNTPFHKSPQYDGLPFFDVDGLLQEIYFYCACAQRLFEQTGVLVRPEIIPAHISVTDPAGALLSGNASRYHSSAFDWGSNSDESVRNGVVCGDLTPRDRAEVRLWVSATASLFAEK